MNVLFINDSRSNPNWGDRAAAISLSRMVMESGGRIIRSISESELSHSTFSNAKRNNKETNSNEVSLTRAFLKDVIPPFLLTIRHHLIQHTTHCEADDVIPNRWEDFDTKLEYIVSNKSLYSELLNAIDNSHLLVIHGNGCMSGCGRIPRSELFLTYIAKKLFSKPVIILNHTVDLSHPILKKMAIEVYPLFDDVVYRENISAKINSDLCNGRFAPDTAFLFEPASLDSWLPVAQRPNYFDVWPDRADFDPSEPYMCIGGSGIYYYNLNYDAVRGFSILIEHLRSLYTGQIVLTVSDIRDQSIFRPISEQQNLPLVGLNTPVQQCIDILGNAEAYIGGRWHPSIFSLRGGTPIISLSSNTFMMQALAEMSGFSRAFDALNLEGEKVRIGIALMSSLEQGKELRNSLRAWAELASKNSWNNVAYLKKLTEKS